MKDNSPCSNKSILYLQELHGEVSAARKDVAAVDDIRQDLSLMEQEREQLSRRIDKIERRVATMEDHEQWLELATHRRLAAEKEEMLAQQKHDQRSALMHVDQKISRLQQQLRDLREQADTADPTGAFANAL